MKAAIRLAVFLVIAGASTSVLADSGSEAADGRALQQTKQVGSATNPTNDGEEVRHGSGEPWRSYAATKADESAANDAAIKNYNQMVFLSEVWARP